METLQGRVFHRSADRGMRIFRKLREAALFAQDSWIEIPEPQKSSSDLELINSLEGILFNFIERWQFYCFICGDSVKKSWQKFLQHFSSQ